MRQRHDYDLAVVGGGSGGFGAALAAARRGLRVLLVEAGPILGGTSTLAGVNTWESCATGPGLHAELFQRLSRRPSVIGVGRTTKFWTDEQPWGFSAIDRTAAYRDTLRRSTLTPADLRRATFEPDALAAEMAAMLAETRRVDVRLGARFAGAAAQGRKLARVVFECCGKEHAVRPRFVVDATGDIAVCQAVGCRTYLGAEPRSLYGEPGAPEHHVNRLNGVTICYRVTPTEKRAVEPPPEGVPDEPFERPSSICQYPCGDLNVNPLPIMDGWEFHELGPAEGRHECARRTWRHWRWLQSRHGFDRHKMVAIAPMVGVREGPRLMARRVLTENDLRAGCAGQRDLDRGVALSDHALDVHGSAAGGCVELAGPYAVPYDCLLPVEYDNLSVACRGAGLSHIAASSCRLSRAMMGLGHAAGLAAAAAVSEGGMLPEVDVATVRQWLAEENVALDPDDERFPAVKRS